MSKQIFEDYSVSIHVKRAPNQVGGSEVIMTVVADEDTLAGLGAMARGIGGGWSELAQGLAVVVSQPGFMQAISGMISKPKMDAEFDPRRGAPRSKINRRAMKAQGRQTGPVPSPAPPPAGAGPQGPVITPPPSGFKPGPVKVKPLKKK